MVTDHCFAMRCLPFSYVAKDRNRPAGSFSRNETTYKQYNHNHIGPTDEIPEVYAVKTSSAIDTIIERSKGKISQLCCETNVSSYTTKYFITKFCRILGFYGDENDDLSFDTI